VRPVLRGAAVAHLAGMSSRNPPSRLARARNVLFGVLAVALYGFQHRTELVQIFDELRAALPLGSRAETAVNSTWLESDGSQIP